MTGNNAVRDGYEAILDADGNGTAQNKDELDGNVFIISQQKLFKNLLFQE